MIKLSSLFNIRKWRIVIALAYLNVRFFWFESKLINSISEYRSVSSVKIARHEIAFANIWNQKLSVVFSFLGSSYTACLKRSFFLSLLIDAAVEAEVLMGVVPGNNSIGHAWIVDACGTVIAEHFDATKTDYLVIKRYAVR